MTRPLHAYMQRISSSLAEHAVAVMPAARKEWARAMRAELASLDEGIERVRWSLNYSPSRVRCRAPTSIAILRCSSEREVSVCGWPQFLAIGYLEVAPSIFSEVES